MFSTICNQIKNKLIKVKLLKVKPLKVNTLKVEEQVIKKTSIYQPNKLISSFEEDYTRNNKEINQLRQRN